MVQHTLFDINNNMIRVVENFCQKRPVSLNIRSVSYLLKPARPWASYQIHSIAGCACAGNAGNVFPRHRLQRKPLVCDPGMHHGTCVTHMPWCMSGSRWRVKRSRHSRRMRTRNFPYLARGPCRSSRRQWRKTVMTSHRWLNAFALEIPEIYTNLSTWYGILSQILISFTPCGFKSMDIQLLCCCKNMKKYEWVWFP